MAMALACGTRQRLSEVNPDGALYFIEKLLFQIYEHFDEQVLVDVTFKFSNPPALITAHRLILSAASPYFRQLFKSEEGICPLIEISDIDSDIFERLITFCYTGKTLITIENVDRMLKAALILQLDEAVANCIDFLMEYITDYTLARAYTFENEVQCALLSAKIYEYEIRNFASVIQSTEFLNFDVTKLQKILESDDLNITTEKEAFKAVKRWYEYDESARKQKVFDLISCLRLSQFHTNFIMENINPLPGCHVLAMEAISWVNVPSTRENVSLRFTSPRPRIAEAFMAFNFWDEDSRTIFQYNTTEDLWQKWVDIKPGVPDVQAIFMDDNLFLIGGIRNNTAINEVNSWNFRTKLFQRLPPMNQPRYLHCVVELNHKVYVVGGKGEDDEILNSVEMYTASDGWESINAMITPRCWATAVVFNEKIYVFGGHDGDDLKSVECYNPITNNWTQCADMNEGHSNPGASVHNGQIFVVGGCNLEEESSTVERYDAQRNEWTRICSLNIGCEKPYCISIYNQLWCVGGGVNNRTSDCVSVYDEQNDKWIDKKPMPEHSFYYCFTVPNALL
ncbi:kelch-like protein 5 isoform X2 [Eurosta solidaginis]|uniref:kelch-like protein 5 isoform X2 n=1 Tax=Eurosta solidaginis TaxID=178769 RepID=UPI003530A36E